MKTKELKAERIRNGYTQKKLASLIGMHIASYRKKEHGEVAFSDAEKKKLYDVLNLSNERFMDIFIK